VERLHWRIWNGKGRNAQRGIKRIAACDALVRLLLLFEVGLSAIRSDALSQFGAMRRTFNTHDGRHGMIA
jgi:hypothetical protein